MRLDAPSSISSSSSRQLTAAVMPEHVSDAASRLSATSIPPSFVSGPFGLPLLVLASTNVSRRNASVRLTWPELHCVVEPSPGGGRHASSAFVERNCRRCVLHVIIDKHIGDYRVILSR
jgi:hypothetical protein